MSLVWWLVSSGFLSSAKLIFTSSSSNQYRFSQFSAHYDILTKYTL